MDVPLSNLCQCVVDPDSLSCFSAVASAIYYHCQVLPLPDTAIARYCHRQILLFLRCRFLPKPFQFLNHESLHFTTCYIPSCSHVVKRTPQYAVRCPLSCVSITTPHINVCYKQRHPEHCLLPECETMHLVG